MGIQIKTTGLENYLDPTDEQAYVKCLIAGEPGTGKTRTAAFWPKPIYADCENGLKSVADRRVPFASIKSTKDMRDFIDHLKRECMKRGAGRQYQTAVLDTLDKLQAIARAEILAETPGKLGLSGWKDWQKLGDKVVPLYTDFIALPMNIIVNVHVKETSGEDDETAVEDENEKYYGLRLAGDLRNVVTADIDLVGHLHTTFVREGKGKRRMERRIRWNNDPTFPVLKDRSGSFPDYTVVDFSERDYLGLIELMMGDRADALQPQTMVEVIPDAEPEPTRAVPPTPGGPVAAKKAAAPRKAAQAEPVAAEKATPAAKRAPAKKAAAAPVSNPADEATGPSMLDILDGAHEAREDQGQAAVLADPVEQIADALGAKVIEDTKVDEPEPDAPPAQPVPTQAQHVAAATKDAIICGTPYRSDDTPVPGCGQPIGPETSRRDLQVGQLKTRTNLHKDCYDKHRASAR